MSEEAPINGTAIVVASGDLLTVDLAISVWLDEKARHTNSARTHALYQETINQFRMALRAHGLDLDSPREKASKLVVSELARQFAEERHVNPRRPQWRLGMPVTPATFNQRLSVISSFYEYARRRDLLNVVNPIEALTRKTQHPYENAQAIDARHVAQHMTAIDRETLDGMRDYALLAIGLSTGRRSSELATLTWGSVSQQGGVVTLTFAKTKRAKVMRDALPKPIGEALMRWLYRWYGAEVAKLAADAPLWVALEIQSRGHQLTARSISNICKRRLKVTKVHALRHTFAHGMEAVGAKASEIQARLGHSSLQTTGLYLTALNSAENAHGDDLVLLFGLK